MNSLHTAALINLIGFTTGAALYAMLLVMVLTRRDHPLLTTTRADDHHTTPPVNKLLLATAVLGLLWNLGALVVFGFRDVGGGAPLPLLSAVSFTALGFLPAVVVHSALRSLEGAAARAIKVAAYLLSSLAGLMHFAAALRGESPSTPALRLLVFGYAAIVAALFLITRRQPGARRAVWATALAVFAVSALHLTNHQQAGINQSWVWELLGHHASLPLALAILYQDYRFAFADIFLKRALALLSVIAFVFALYATGVVSALTGGRDADGQPDPRSTVILLGLWVVTALLYPVLRDRARWFVDHVVLVRVDYDELRGEVARALAAGEDPPAIVERVGEILCPALSARVVKRIRLAPPDEAAEAEITHLAQIKKGTSPDAGTIWRGEGDPIGEFALVAESGRGECVTLLDRTSGASAVVFIPTAEPPYEALVVGPLAGGRRLLSDDVEMLESVASLIARRIDVLRVTHERCERSLREQQISQLATEAQLKALRAQINPHFLFNALTTIGYLVQVAPERALETLLRLTTLLRGVLGSTGEFVTLDDELKLIASYLEIERARFEERLRVSVDVPPELRSLRVPSLLVQPLVENAIKHGIAPARAGGEVRITARLEKTNAGAEMLCVTVSDTGVGASEIDIARGRRRGGVGSTLR